MAPSVPRSIPRHDHLPRIGCQSRWSARVWGAAGEPGNFWVSPRRPIGVVVSDTYYCLETNVICRRIFAILAIALLLAFTAGCTSTSASGDTSARPLLQRALSATNDAPSFHVQYRDKSSSCCQCVINPPKTACEQRVGQSSDTRAATDVSHQEALEVSTSGTTTSASTGTHQPPCEACQEVRQPPGAPFAEVIVGNNSAQSDDGSPLSCARGYPVPEGAANPLAALQDALTPTTDPQSTVTFEKPAAIRYLGAPAWRITVETHTSSNENSENLTVRVLINRSSLRAAYRIREISVTGRGGADLLGRTRDRSVETFSRYGELVRIKLPSCSRR
jgi:hypothetical protein